MDIKINENIIIRKKYNPFLESFNIGEYKSNDSEYMAFKTLGINPTQIIIRGIPYEVVHPIFAVRSRNVEDNYYRFIYIQINYETGEYYIGKVNRKSYGEIQRYNGSGLKFRAKYKNNPAKFVRYFIAICRTAKETEEIEASIVNEELLKDPFCLNLVCGGGGTNEHPRIEERIEKQRKYMEEHPDQYKSMLKACKELYTIGETSALRQRSAAIKKTMSSDYYRNMMSERIRKWKSENPEEYASAREKNRRAMQTPEVKEKKKISREKWKKEHPEEYAKNIASFVEATQTPVARLKRSESLRRWSEEHPEQAKTNAKKRSEAMAVHRRKPVGMYDLETNNLLRVFPGVNEAGRWLQENGYTKSVNPASSISAVCRCAPCTTGYGFRKKAFGFSWKFIDPETGEQLD